MPFINYTTISTSFTQDNSAKQHGESVITLFTNLYNHMTINLCPYMLAPNEKSPLWRRGILMGQDIIVESFRAFYCCFLTKSINLIPTIPETKTATTDRIIATIA